MVEFHLRAFNDDLSPRAPAPTPPAIAIDPNTATFLGSVSAVGSQIYVRGSDGAWHFSRPQADLFVLDGEGQEVKVGEHYGVLHGTSYAPNWKQTLRPDDDSSVEATKDATAPPDSPDSIPWLRLKVLSHSGSGPDNTGHGVFAGTNYIQRIDTHGGVASAEVPEAEPPAGTEQSVPYTATYQFWGAIFSSTGGL